MLIYRGHEQLKPIYDNVSGTSKIYNQIYNVFSNIANRSGKGSLYKHQYWNTGGMRALVSSVGLCCIDVLMNMWEN